MQNLSCPLSLTLMELIYKLSAAVSCGIVVVILAWRVLNWVWFRPRKLEKYLRQQGFDGNSYRLFFGDGKEMAMIIKEAKSKPINLSDDVVPRMVPVVHKTIQNYGKNYFLWLGPTPLVSIMDPDLIREVLNKNYHFQRPSGGNPLTKLIASGLIGYEGDKWAKHRKIIAPAFSLVKLKSMLPAFYLSCSEIMSKWEQLVSIEGQCELDVQPYLETLTSDAISRTAFGSSYEKGRRIFQLQKEQVELVVQFKQSIYLPGMRFLPTKRNKRMKEIAKEVEAALRSMIHERLNVVEAGETNPDDLLGILLDSNSNEIKHGNKNSGMSIDEIIEECKLFYFVGQHSTANLLVWTMILLSHYQDWQHRARVEVLQVFGYEKPDIDGLNRLKIVNMILLEVLRLYPPGPLLHRTMYENTKLGEISLPAGVIVQLPVILLHHDDEIWGDDAKEFKPERFSKGVSKATKTGGSAYFPFGWGPRICLGQNFAMLEAKMAVAMILQRFCSVISPSYTHAPHIFMTPEPQHGAHLILKAL